jgi:glucokinase
MNASSPQSDAWLVADVGGTNIRFGLAVSGRPGILAPDSIRALRVDAFDTPSSATRHYLDAIGAQPSGAVYAIAGPTDGASAQLTNHRWSFSAAELRHALGMKPVSLINDFAAIAHALPALTDADLSPLGPRMAPGRAAGPRTLAVVGPGTGLGVAALILRSSAPLVLETEGGHASFAPETPEEVEIFAHLARRFGRVSWERVLCGSGLVNIHRALREMAGDPPARPLTPESITERANARSDRHSVRAVEVFCGLLGAFAGDLALAFGAWDGVYLAGGIPVPLAPWLEQGEFRRRFENKGRFAATMTRIPAALILHPYPGLLGAACRAMAVAGESG